MKPDERTDSIKTLNIENRKLLRAIARIRNMALSQYSRRAPASSDLCDNIAALAEDALKGRG